MSDFDIIFEKMEQDDYEQLVFCHDKASGMRAIICIHDSTLGPAIGGLRYWEYDSIADAAKDAMRLARGMTYKSAAAGLPSGGAKAVMLKDPNRPKTEAMMRAFGRFVDGLSGRYITAEDVGTTEEDMDWIFQETDYVVGTSMKPGTSGNPSPVTAHGVYMGMKAAAKQAFGSDSLEGKRVLVQGIGSVGYNLCADLHKEGAKLFVTDIRPESVKRAVEDFGATAVSADDFIGTECDIFSPCALGAILNDDTIPKLKCKVVAGAANNQLAEERHGQMLEDRGIVYAPDFILNAGGVINVADELFGGYNQERAMKKVKGVYRSIERVYEIAKRDHIAPHIAANRLAEERIHSIRHTKKIYTPYNKSILDIR